MPEPQIRTHHSSPCLKGRGLLVRSDETHRNLAGNTTLARFLLSLQRLCYNLLSLMLSCNALPVIYHLAHYYTRKDNVHDLAIIA
jgi:hypothetical protein